MLHIVQRINSIAWGRCGGNFESVISEYMLKFMGTSSNIALRWMPQNTFDIEVIIGTGDGLLLSGNKVLP